MSSTNSYFLILSSSFFFFFFFLLSVQIAFSDQDHDRHRDHQQQQEAEAVRIDVMHRHHPDVHEKLHGDTKKIENMNDRLKDIHEHDHKRHRSITKSLNRNQVEEDTTALAPDPVIPPASPTPIGLKMISGSEFGSSEYFVQLKVGTPPQTFMLIVDTGSDLTWVKCRYRRCIGNCTANANHKSRNEKKVKFNNALLANQSSSFQTIPCSSKMCSEGLAELFSLKECETPTSPCRYDYR